MCIRDRFLDSASLRSSIVSHAKMLGYEVSSPRAPIATINVSLTTTNATATMSAGTTFNTTVDGVNYQFVTISDVTSRNTGSSIPFDSLEIYEGTFTRTKYIVDSQEADQRFMLTDVRADTTTLTVKVQNSATNLNAETYSQSETIAGVKSTSKVYYLEERTDGYYQVVFGDGVLGKQLDVGNIVICEYIISNGTRGNGARAFSPPTNITGNQETLNGKTKAVAAGGYELETTDSIRFNAPRFNSAKGRVVTSTDYETAIKQSNPNIKSVTVWGG